MGCRCKQNVQLSHCKRSNDPHGPPAVTHGCIALTLGHARLTSFATVTLHSGASSSIKHGFHPTASELEGRLEFIGGSLSRGFSNKMLHMDALMHPARRAGIRMQGGIFPAARARTTRTGRMLSNSFSRSLSTMRSPGLPLDGFIMNRVHRPNRLLRQPPAPPVASEMRELCDPKSEAEMELTGS